MKEFLKYIVTVIIYGLMLFFFWKWQGFEFVVLIALAVILSILSFIWANKE